MIRALLLAILIGLGLLMVADAVRRAPYRSPPRPALLAREVATVRHPPPLEAPSIISGGPETPIATPALDMIARLAVRRRIVREGDRVYLDSMFARTDSLVTRWAGRSALRVALIADTTLAEWNPSLLDEARTGLHAWDDNPSGLALQEVAAEDSADITVHWVETLADSGQVGLTTLNWGADGEVYHATISLALRRNTDSLAVPPAVRARVAAHEFGHALGLPHSGDGDDLMFPTSPVAVPSPRDKATLRLLYAIPPGALRVQPQ